MYKFKRFSFIIFKMQRNIKSGRGVSKGFFGDILGAGASALGGLSGAAGEAVGGLVGARYGGVPGMILGQAAGGAAGGAVQGLSGLLGGALKGLPFQKGGVLKPPMGITTPFKMNPMTGRMEPDFSPLTNPLIMYQKGGIIMKPKAKKAKKARKARK
jgi:hypothetical protein